MRGGWFPRCRKNAVQDANRRDANRLGQKAVKAKKAYHKECNIRYEDGKQAALHEGCDPSEVEESTY